MDNIVTPKSLTRSCPIGLDHQDSYTENSDFSTDCEPPKKKRVRARLDHLTPSEKLQRRKMKNRIAAQTARDRKRAKIDYLEEENKKLREENERLRSKLEGRSGSDLVIATPTTDSGVSEAELMPKTSATTSMVDANEMDALTVPKQSANCPFSPSSSSSGAFSASPAPEAVDYLDSVVGRTDEASLIDDILQLQASLFSEPGNDNSIESAELINVPQQKVQEASYQSRLVENSAGWTSIQLMLLLMISRVHHLYSWRTNCCAMISENTDDRYGLPNNLYDHILRVKCPDFKRAAEAIISFKNNIRHQRMVALEYVYTHLYSRGRTRAC